jgi:hypothetical protein
VTREEEEVAPDSAASMAIWASGAAARRSATGGGLDGAAGLGPMTRRGRHSKRAVAHRLGRQRRRCTRTGWWLGPALSERDADGFYTTAHGDCQVGGSHRQVGLTRQVFQIKNFFEIHLQRGKNR